MNITTLMPIFRGLWLMEESQAQKWADIAHSVLVEKQAASIWGSDTAPHRFLRVDQNAVESADGPVLVIPINGPVMQNNYCGTPGMFAMDQAIRAAQKDDTIKSIVLWIDSPGGTVSGTENLANSIRKSKKPVVAFTHTMMASAAYWIGSAAREVIADGSNKGYNSVIGSIGTKAVILDRTAEQEQKGWKTTTVYATKSTRKGKYADDIMAGNTDRLQKELDQINDTFIDAVQAQRAGKLKATTENIFEGDTYNARQALALGLVDKIADFDYAVKRSLQLALTQT